MEQIKLNDYNSKEDLEKDIKLFIERIGITREEFDEIINNKIRVEHTQFKNFDKTFNFFKKIRDLFRKK